VQGAASWWAILLEMQGISGNVSRLTAEVPVLHRVKGLRKEIDDRNREFLDTIKALTEIQRGINASRTIRDNPLSRLVQL
jgi:hypothetical protein